MIMGLHMDIQEHSDEDLAAVMAKASLEDNEMLFKTCSKTMYDRYQRQVYKLCRYYGLQHADAEDAAQEAFVKLLRSAGTYREGARFKSWFFKIVMNIVRDHYRAKKRMHYSDPEEFSDIPSENRHFTKETHNQLIMEKLLSQLPAKLKDTVTLRVFGALDSESIASVIGVSDRQVRNRLEQAYNLLRKMGVENEFQS